MGIKLSADSAVRSFMEDALKASDYLKTSHLST